MGSSGSRRPTPSVCGGGGAATAPTFLEGVVLVTS
jgi:hypothetical protein